jgi:uncharacterized protein (TIGR03435 family)
LNSLACSTLTLFLNFTGFFQSVAQTPTFEVASIRPNHTTGGRPNAEFLSGGQRFAATNISLANLIIVAYGITPRQIGPLPPITFEKYDILASTDHPVSRDQMRRMIQSLLADRFKLKIHPESKELSVYELVVDKHGPKLQRGQGQLPWNLTRSRGSEQDIGGVNHITFTDESMADFASVLSTLLAVGRMVIDKTGLSGNYDFGLKYTRADRPIPPSDADAPSIFTAMQEQLGLRLEPAKGPVEILVVDHVERPDEN